MSGKGGADSGPSIHLQKLAFGKLGIHGGNNRKVKVLLAVSINSYKNSGNKKKQVWEKEIFFCFNGINAYKK